MRTSACRTARCTVTAASNWLSLLSSETRERLRARVMVSGPGLPVGPAQAASGPSAHSPAPSRNALRRDSAGDLDWVIVDLSVWHTGPACGRPVLRGAPLHDCVFRAMTVA